MAASEDQGEPEPFESGPVELCPVELCPVELGPVELGPIAHGGHCVARVDGRVVFVRHGIPGETVRVRVTDDSKARFWWGEVSEVLDASPDRVTPPCPIAGTCGGCDFQHVTLPRQRDLKAQVVSEQLHRLAGLDWPLIVEPVPGDVDGLGWRTRMRYLLRGGAVGLRAWRSDALVELPPGGCRIAHPAGPDDLGQFADRDGELEVVVAASGVSVLRSGELLSGTELVTERTAARDWQVRADGFWQVHPGAAQTLVDAALGALEPRAGERALDLYCGVGLFAGALVDAGCRVTGMESSAAAIELAQRNVPQGRFLVGRVERALHRLPRRTDLVLLDPPRTGAGREVVQHVSGRGARRICYVACDPAALARDLATFASNGYDLVGLRAFDIFPMTHHIECVALLEPR